MSDLLVKHYDSIRKALRGNKFSKINALKLIFSKNLDSFYDEAADVLKDLIIYHDKYKLNVDDIIDETYPKGNTKSKTKYVEALLDVLNGPDSWYVEVELLDALDVRMLYHKKLFEYCMQYLNKKIENGKVDICSEYAYDNLYYRYVMNSLDYLSKKELNTLAPQILRILEYVRDPKEIVYRLPVYLILQFAESASKNLLNKFYSVVASPYWRDKLEDVIRYVKFMMGHIPGSELINLLTFCVAYLNFFAKDYTQEQLSELIQLTDKVLNRTKKINQYMQLAQLFLDHVSAKNKDWFNRFILDRVRKLVKCRKNESFQAILQVYLSRLYGSELFLEEIKRWSAFLNPSWLEDLIDSMAKIDREYVTNLDDRKYIRRLVRVIIDTYPISKHRSLRQEIFNKMLVDRDLFDELVKSDIFSKLLL